MQKLRKSSLYEHVTVKQDKDHLKLSFAADPTLTFMGAYRTEFIFPMLLK